MLLFSLCLLSTAIHRVAVSASYCPITVSYEVSLGQAPLAAASRDGSDAGGPNDFSDIPIFFAKVGVFSNNVRCPSSSQHGLSQSLSVLHVHLLCHLKSGCPCLAQATVDTWRLGWNFTAGETVQGGNIYTAGVDVLKINGSTVQLESQSHNNTVMPFSWTTVSFLGTKASMPTPRAPYRVKSTPTHIEPVRKNDFCNFACKQGPR